MTVRYQAIPNPATPFEAAVKQNIEVLNGTRPGGTLVDAADGQATRLVNTGLLKVKGNSVQVTDEFVPGASTDIGAVGEIRWGSGYLYVCVATNSWKRATLAAF